MIRKVFPILLVLGIGTSGVLGGLYAVGAIGIPDAGLADNEWGEVTDDEIEVITTLWLDNPNPAIEPDDLDVEYAVAMNDVHLADGAAEDLTMPSGNTTTELSTSLRYRQLPAWWASHVENDEVSELRVDTTAHVSVGPFSGSPSHTSEDEKETDLETMIEEALAAKEGEHTLSPVSTGTGPQRQLVEPTVEIRDTEAEWGEVTEEETELYLTFEVHNPNAYPLPMPALTGEMEFNDRAVAEWKANEVELLEGTYDSTIPPQGTREITFVATMDNDDVVAWFATHVDNDEITDAEMRTQLAMHVDGETRTIPDDGDAIQCEYDMRTDIFVEQEPGTDQRDCTFVPWATPDDETFEDLGATIDLADTDRWADEGGDSGDGSANESDDGDLPRLPVAGP